MGWEEFLAEVRPKAGVCILYDSEIVRLIGAARDETDYYYVVACGQQNRHHRVSCSSAAGHLNSLKGVMSEDAIERMDNLISLRGGVPREYPWIEVDLDAGEFPEDLNRINEVWRAAHQPDPYELLATATRFEISPEVFVERREPHGWAVCTDTGACVDKHNLERVREPQNREYFDEATRFKHLNDAVVFARHYASLGPEGWFPDLYGRRNTGASDVSGPYLHPMGLMRSPSGRVMRMSHMLADTSEELMAMAAAIGMRPEWIQKPGTAREHFDVPLFRRRIAVQHGAREITMREAVALVKNRSSSRQK